MNELKYRLRKVGGIGDDAADFIEQQAAEIERLNDRWAEWKDSLNSVMEQRNALQDKLSAMEKQEPFGYFCEWKSHVGYPATQILYYGEPGSATEDDWNCYPEVHHNVPLYTAPKVAQPLSEEERSKLYRKSALQDRIVVRSDWEQGVRDAEAAHGIGGQQP